MIMMLPRHSKLNAAEVHYAAELGAVVIAAMIAKSVPMGGSGVCIKTICVRCWEFRPARNTNLKTGPL